jgi:hypothetical protein
MNHYQTILNYFDSQEAFNDLTAEVINAKTKAFASQ